MHSLIVSPASLVRFHSVSVAEGIEACRQQNKDELSERQETCFLFNSGCKLHGQTQIIFGGEGGGGGGGTVTTDGLS